MPLIDISSAQAGLTALRNTAARAASTAAGGCNLFGSLNSILGSSVGGLAGNIQGQIGQAVSAIGNITGISSNVLSNVVALSSEIDSKMQQVLALAAIANAAGNFDLANRLTNAVNDIENAVNSSLGQINSVFSNVSNLLSNIDSQLGSAIAGLANPLGQAAAAISAASCGNFGAAISSFPQGVSSLVDAINGGSTPGEVANIVAGAAAIAALDDAGSQTSGVNSDIEAASTDMTTIGVGSVADLASQLTILEQIIADGDIEA